MFGPRLLIALVCLATFVAGRGAAQTIVVASKQDAETAILAEMAAALIRAGGSEVRLSHSLGGTPVVWQAMLRGEVDVYPEYTGTIAQQILHDPSLTDIDRLRQALAPRGIGLTRPLGFANNYALGMTATRASDSSFRKYRSQR